MTDLNKAAILEWVEALESGEYQQTTGTLAKYKADGGLGYCCLGVACDLLADRAGVTRGAIGDFDNSTQYMSNAMIAFLGVEGSGEGDYDNGDLGWQGVTVHIPPHLRQEYLAHEGDDDCDPHAAIVVDLVSLNDELRWDFNKIADCIEYTYLTSPHSPNP